VSRADWVRRVLEQLYALRSARQASSSHAIADLVHIACFDGADAAPSRIRRLRR